VNKQEEQEVLGNARLAMLKELQKAWDNDGLEEVLSDMAEEALLKLNPGGIPDDFAPDAETEAIDRWYDKIQDFVDQVKRQFIVGETNPVSILVSFDPIYGTHVELFSSRPHTQNHPLNDPENWGKWYRVYEGNIDGGDSILVDALGRDLMG
jgi:hypothetical protein